MSTLNAQRLLQSLNDVQSRATLHRDGPMVVFAGAGSGKTRIITTRIAYLLETDVSPREILAVTFTNKAAGEMKTRVEELSPMGRGCLISTFHSACARWLREFAVELGFTADFTIYDDSDVVTALKAIGKELNVDLDISALIPEWKQFISRAKMQGFLPSDAERLQETYGSTIPSGGIRIYKRYQEYLAGCNAMDFADLILNTLLLLRRNEFVRQTLQNRYKYVMVDEYQDTNRSQLELISILVQKHRNLFVVGDDDQSIYSWRGATPGSILDFDRIYPEAIKITLEQNYRCTGNIVSGANAMIANNIKRAEKKLWTNNSLGDLIGFKLEYDGEAEARFVVENIRKELSRFPLSDVAIFYRTNSQSRLLEEALRAENIPYQIFGGMRFYDRMEIKDILAYMRLIVNEDDDVSFRRVVNVPSRKIGPKALEHLESVALKQNQSLYKTLGILVKDNDPNLPDKLKKFHALVNDIKQNVPDIELGGILEYVVRRVEYFDYLRKKYSQDEAVDKIENINELGTAISEFDKRNPGTSLAGWLQVITLNSSADQESTGGVAMMTLHMAKGLEFKRVYIVGVEEGLLPHGNNTEDLELLEEERRLFYVGMTRSREKLTLSSAYRRRLYDRWMSNKPSRFVKEIPAKFMDVGQDRWSSMLSGISDKPNEFFDSNRDEAKRPGTVQKLSKGASVFHPTYGKGTVEAIMQFAGEIDVEVNFSEFGKRSVKSQHLLTNPV